jgi:hypothetical protein
MKILDYFEFLLIFTAFILMVAMTVAHFGEGDSIIYVIFCLTLVVLGYMSIKEIICDD